MCADPRLGSRSMTLARTLHRAAFYDRLRPSIRRSVAVKRMLCFPNKAVPLMTDSPSPILPEKPMPTDRPPNSGATSLGLGVLVDRASRPSG